MDDDFTVNFLHPESDRGSGSPAAAESRSESTRWNSLESGVTVESSRWCSCESCDGEDARPSMFLFFKRALPVGKLAWNGNAMRSITISEDECSGWTNEKHSSYLDYLEKSFVRQLYCLMEGKTGRSFRTHDPPANSYRSTDQFGDLTQFVIKTF